MCGFTGFFKGSIFNSEIKVQENLQNMADVIRHRGPDSEGFWFDQQSKIALAHRRLAILELSKMGHQPMGSHSKRYVIAFNGEIYNHLELRKYLNEENVNILWKGHSDTETLLAAFEQWGIIATLEKLEGMFAFAVWDNKDQELTLARDRFGEKPLYYGWQNGSLLFGSELKSLVQCQNFEKVIDKNAVALLLRHTYIPSPYSIWENIHKLPAGCYIKFSNNLNTMPVCYWSFKEIAEKSINHKINLDDKQLINKLDEYLTNVIEKQMVSDVPLGALLSGGVDSSTIVAIMQKISKTPIQTFSIGFEDPKFDESKHAEAIAEYLGTNHQTLVMKPQDIINLVPQMAKIYDEPFADSSQLPTTMVMQLVKEKVTVALSGDAGDELFAGYSRYFLVIKLWSIFKWIPVELRGKMVLFAWLSEKLSTFIKKSNLTDKLYKLSERLKNVKSFNDLYYSYLTEIQNTSSIVLGSSENINYLLGDQVRWPKLENPIEKMMALDTLTYLTDDILVKVDRAAMASSLEVRVPFLSHVLAEFVWKIPISNKIRGGKSKWILRQVLYRYVPEALLDRPKKGFNLPLNEWLRGPLKDWAEDLLSTQNLNKHHIFDTDYVRNIWLQHLSGKRQFGYRLWSILMFQVWYAENFH